MKAKNAKDKVSSWNEAFSRVDSAEMDRACSAWLRKNNPGFGVNTFNKIKVLGRRGRKTRDEMNPLNLDPPL